MVLNPTQILKYAGERKDLEGLQLAYLTINLVHYQYSNDSNHQKNTDYEVRINY